MSEKRCRARTQDRWASHCTRPAGYGPGGEYCKQHAKKYEPEPEATGIVIYKLGKYGDPKILSTPIIKETKELFIIPNKATGFYSTRVPKYEVSLSPKEAIEKYIAPRLKQIEELEGQIAKARKLLEGIKH